MDAENNSTLSETLTRLSEAAGAMAILMENIKHKPFTPNESGIDTKLFIIFSGNIIKNSADSCLALAASGRHGATLAISRSAIQSSVTIFRCVAGPSGTLGYVTNLYERSRVLQELAKQYPTNAQAVNVLDSALNDLRQQAIASPIRKARYNSNDLNSMLKDACDELKIKIEFGKLKFNFLQNLFLHGASHGNVLVSEILDGEVQAELSSIVIDFASSLFQLACNVAFRENYLTNDLVE